MKGAPELPGSCIASYQAVATLVLIETLLAHQEVELNVDWLPEKKWAEIAETMFGLRC